MWIYCCCLFMKTTLILIFIIIREKKNPINTRVLETKMPTKWSELTI